MSDESNLDEFMLIRFLRYLCLLCPRFKSYLVKQFPKLGTFLLVYRQIYRPWKKYIHNLSPDEPIGQVRYEDELIRQVRYEIAKKYFDREANGIDGKEKAHKAEDHIDETVIITDFINYAELVKTIVEKSLDGVRKRNKEKASLDGVRKRNKEKAILCFTSLRFSLHDWFNFDRGLYSDSKWYKEYLEKIGEWSNHQNHQDIIVARHLLCAHDEKLAQACGIKGRTKEVLKQELQSWIWRPFDGQGKARLKPIHKSSGCDSRNSLAGDIDREAQRDDLSIEERDELLKISKFIKERYNEPKKAFVIVDNTGTELDEFDFETGKFQRLSHAFSSTYQTELRNVKGHFLTYGVANLADDPDYSGTYYMPHDEKNQRPIATDFFLVCTVEKAKLDKVKNPYQIFEILRPEPLVCLEGRDLAKAVHLTLLDAGKNKRCLNIILSYCEKLLLDNKENEDLFSNA